MLNVQLIPQSCFYKNIRNFVSISIWKNIRNQVLNRCNNKCVICGASNKLEAHEIFSYKIFPKNTRSSMQTLIRIDAYCKMCHMCVHIGNSERLGYLGLCIKHLMKINNWSEQQVKEYLVNSFAEWSYRNTLNWSTDLSHLEKEYNIKI